MTVHDQLYGTDNITSFHSLVAVHFLTRSVCGTMVINNRTLVICHIRKFIIKKETLGQQRALSLVITCTQILYMVIWIMRIHQFSFVGIIFFKSSFSSQNCVFLRHVHVVTKGYVFALSDLSVPSHVSAWLPLDEFLWNLILGTLHEKSVNMFQIRQKYRVLYLKT